MSSFPFLVFSPLPSLWHAQHESFFSAISLVLSLSIPSKTLLFSIGCQQHASMCDHDCLSGVEGTPQTTSGTTVQQTYMYCPWWWDCTPKWNFWLFFFFVNQACLSQIFCTVFRDRCFLFQGTACPVVTSAVLKINEDTPSLKSKILIRFFVNIQLADFLGWKYSRGCILVK